MKRIIAVLAVFALSLVLAVSAFAAGGLNDYETKILDACQQAMDGITMTEWQKSNAKSYLAQARTYFSRDDIDMTEAQYNSLIDDLEKAKTALGTDISGFSVRSKYIDNTAFTPIADHAAATMSLKVVVSGDRIVSLVGSDGNVVATTKDVVNSTGTALTLPLLTAGAVLVLGAASVLVVLRKRRLAA